MTPSPAMLSWIVFTPLVGMAVVLLLRDARTIKRVALAASALTLLISLAVAALGDPSAAGAYGKLTLAQRFAWIATADGSFRVDYFLGVDGLSAPMVVLTALITLLAIAASWNIETWKSRGGVRGYFAMLLLLETGMLGVFLALDFFLFYIFWEVMLVPMYFLIGVWGGPRREYAAIKFFLFTLAGSVLMLIVMLAFYFTPPAAVRTFDLLALATSTTIQESFRNATFLGFSFTAAMFVLLLVGFAIKLPLVPLHTWLPDAHVEAPTPVSMILAGVLLKMGGYGLMRISYPILPDAAQSLAVLLAALGVVNILYGSLCTIAQTDLKRLVAYSSIAHMGYVMLGLASLSYAGFNGAMFQMIAHGVSSAMAFYLVGVLYERAGHRDIDRFGGLWATLPRYSALAMIGFFAMLGLPALCGFVGEALAILGAFGSPVLAAAGKATLLGSLAALGAVLAAVYVLWMVQRVFLGPRSYDALSFPDIDRRELSILLPLGVLCILLGVLPKQTVLDHVGMTLAGIVDLAR